MTALTEGFQPGDLGEIVRQHGDYYARHWQFGTVFEAHLAEAIARFAQRQTQTDLVLLARDNAGVAASLILDLGDPTSGDRGARVRWFLVAERLQGTGMGRTMLGHAMAYADRHTQGRAWLGTFAGLDAARHLYESMGFELHAEAEGATYGVPVLEQEFRRQGSPS